MPLKLLRSRSGAIEKQYHILTLIIRIIIRIIFCTINLNARSPGYARYRPARLERVTAKIPAAGLIDEGIVAKGVKISTNQFSAQKN